MIDRLVYYGYRGSTAWAFSTPEELGAWAAQHPDGTFDVQVIEEPEPFEAMSAWVDAIMDSAAGPGIAELFDIVQGVAFAANRAAGLGG